MQNSCENSSGKGEVFDAVSSHRTLERLSSTGELQGVEDQKSVIVGFQGREMPGQEFKFAEGLEMSREATT